MVTMVHITGVEISSSQNVQNKHPFQKASKSFKCDTHNVRNIGNDDVNYVCHTQRGGHHRSRNFAKTKRAKQTAISKLFKTL